MPDTNLIKPSGLAQDMRAHMGLFTEKSFDWDAFRWPDGFDWDGFGPPDGADFDAFSACFPPVTCSSNAQCTARCGPSAHCLPAGYCAPF